MLVADADKPTELSLQVTRALYSSANVVVVAASGDEAGMKAAGAAASRIGAPLLLLDSTASLPENVAAEIHRLRPATVLAVGPDTATALGRLDGVKVTTDATELPKVSRPAQTSTRAVLARTSSGAGSASSGRPGFDSRRRDGIGGDLGRQPRPPGRPGRHHRLGRPASPRR